MTREHRRPRFARNALANWIAFLFAALVGFFLSPFMVEHLGATGYGVWSLISGLLGYLALLDLGIRQAVNRYTARHHAAGEHAENSRIVSAALRLFTFLGLVAAALAVLLAFAAPLLFNIPPELVEDARTIVVVGGVTIALTLVNGVYGGVISGLERFDIQCALEVVVTSIRTAAIVAALLQGYGLVALALIHLGSSMLTFALQWGWVHRIYGELHVRLFDSLGPQIRTILSFSAALTVLYGLGRIIFFSDALVIGAFLPIEQVTFYAIAGSLCMYAREMSRALSYLMTPRVSALMSVGSTVVGDLVVSVARIATLASGPIAVTFLLRGESFISLWMGPAYGPLSGEVLAVLAFAVWLDASRSIVFASLTGMALHRKVIPGAVFEAIFYLGLSVTLVQTLGIVGVAVATLVPCIVINLGYLPSVLSQASGVPVRRFLLRVFVLPGLACMPFALATILCERFMPAKSLVAFFAQVALILPLVPAAAWFLCLTPEERGRLTAAWRTRFQS